jgi:glycosyltransferase involved in cell wall biosynthesis
VTGGKGERWRARCALDLPDVVIVVACYNEAARLDLSAFRAALAQQPALSFVFVNDGSTDGTQALLDGFAAELVPE